MRSVGAFYGLTDDELHKIKNCCDEIALNGDALIFREKDPAEHLYTLCEGRVALRYKLPYRFNGMEHPIAIINPGVTFGWSSLDASAHYRFSAYCTEDNSRALRCNRTTLLKVLEENHTIGYKIMKNLAVAAGMRFVTRQNEIARQETTIS